MSKGKPVERAPTGVHFTPALWDAIREALETGYRQFDVRFEERQIALHIEGDLLSTPEKEQPRLSVTLNVSGDLALLHTGEASHPIGLRGRDA